MTIPVLNEASSSERDKNQRINRLITEMSRRLLASAYTAADVLAKIKTVDGSGSGLDADLLDGQDSSYYTNITARLGYTPRETLASDRTYYVRTDGSDSNTGLTNTPGGAFLTLQKAWDTVAALDLSTFTVTIQIADGTYTAGINAVAVPVGTKPVVIQGNNATPANVLINTTGNGFFASSAAQIMVKNLKIQASGTGIYANHPGAYIQFQNINFGVCGDHVRADTGKIAATGNYTISGGAARHWLAAGIATMLGSGITVTLTGTPAWSGQGFNAQSGGQIVLYAVTFSGLATGQRYSATANGVINSFGAGTASTYFPGNSNGVFSSGGQQI